MTISSLLSIDPDTKEYGWAWFDAGYLTACGVEETPYWPPCVDPELIICEEPEYRGPSRGRKKGQLGVRVADVLKLTFAAGRILGSRPCELFKPSRWKGNLPKEPHHNRMFAVLTSDEHDVLERAAKGLTKDNLLDMNDAVCLGLWRLGRLA